MRTEAEQVGETIPCRDYDAELWFAERPEDVEFAKTLCGLCPARVQCLAGALERSGAVGRLGRAAARPGRRRGSQAAPWPSAQAPRGRLSLRDHA